MSQSPPQTLPQKRRLAAPKAPVLVFDGGKALCLTVEGEIKTLSVAEAATLIRTSAPLLCNMPHMAGRLGLPPFPSYDVLELFAFAQPGKFCVPTPRGMAKALNLMEPLSGEDQLLSLRDAVRHLLSDFDTKSDPAPIAALMEGWSWSPFVLAALERNDVPKEEIRRARKIWDKLPEWSVHAPEPPPGHHGVNEEEAQARLMRLLEKQKREHRPAQHEYAAALTAAFQPRVAEDTPHVVLAEAGTGVGKTLGYLAPATVWAEKNGGAVWVSTYTRNLQKQVESELDRLYDGAEKSRKVVTRKGRENYLCLLNLEDATQYANPQNTTALGLMLRWAAVTEDGDFTGKDFPGWLFSLLGSARVNALADRRGECIYASCAHFNKCFVEKSVRKSRRADIVIANHALVLHQMAGSSDTLPGRYIFDEGHHIFDAADSAFDLHLNGTQTYDLRRWILGTEAEKRTRARGLRRRLEDIIEKDGDAMQDLDAVMHAAKCLPAPLWRQRLHDNAPQGESEKFLIACAQQVRARNANSAGYYSLETPFEPTLPELTAAAAELRTKLRELKRPMLSLAARLQKRLIDEADTLETDARERLRALSESLRMRAEDLLGGWIAMLDPAANKEGFVDWLEITRIEGRDFDFGFSRALLDPARAFAARVKTQAHGLAVTSATLRDIGEDDVEGWKSAQIRTGSLHIAPPKLFHVASPFDYKAQTRVIVVGDVKKENADEVASAYAALFKAAGGGALGIFTAVQRLKAVQEKLKRPLDAAGLPLYAQHVDPLDTGTLIDIFREEENACLLGTDATRDGIDVPGRSLRLVVYDRVPWPRPTILHKARRESFGKGYDDMLTRFKLKQAYGRLIRTATDKGVFVMLDGALPTRLLSAFPEGVTVERVGLKEAIEITKALLSS